MEDEPISHGSQLNTLTKVRVSIRIDNNEIVCFETPKNYSNSSEELSINACQKRSDGQCDENDPDH